MKTGGIRHGTFCWIRYIHPEASLFTKFFLAAATELELGLEPAGQHTYVVSSLYPEISAAPGSCAEDNAPEGYGREVTSMQLELVKLGQCMGPHGEHCHRWPAIDNATVGKAVESTGLTSLTASPKRTSALGIAVALHAGANFGILQR